MGTFGTASSSPLPIEYHTDGCIELDSTEVAAALAQIDSVPWVTLSYARFDVYIDSAYYAHNTPLIDTFCNQLEPRYEALEAITLWRSEDLGGGYLDTTRLRVYISATSNCYEGWAWPGQAYVYLSDPIFRPLCEQASYYDGIPQFGNPGPLGDWWGSMGIAIHEMVHAIHPLAFYQRRWLAEGWARYYELNLLSIFGDINQETADRYIFTGRFGFNWTDYVLNDYRDTYFNDEIQASLGYDITAWMLSMLRDDYSLNWSWFYTMLANNRATLRSADFATNSDLKIDMCILDFLGRATGLDFETEIKPIFRYDGPEGPGWGVRRWVLLDWYGDLEPTLVVSNCAPEGGDTIDLFAEVNNAGLVNMKDVTVRFYNGFILVAEASVDVDSLSSATVSVPFTAPAGDYALFVQLDPDNLKVETNDANNAASVEVSFTNCGPTDTDGDCVADLCDNCVLYATPENVVIMTGDVNNDSKITVADVLCLVNYVFKSSLPPVPIPQAGDVNCDGGDNAGDIVYLSRYVFLGGPEPCDVCKDGTHRLIAPEDTEENRAWTRRMEILLKAPAPLR